jgi:hypothetical protein
VPRNSVLLVNLHFHFKLVDYPPIFNFKTSPRVLSFGSLIGESGLTGQCDLVPVSRPDRAEPVAIDH